MWRAADHVDLTHTTGLAAVIAAAGGVLTSLLTLWVQARRNGKNGHEWTAVVAGLADRIADLERQVAALTAERDALTAERNVLRGERDYLAAQVQDLRARCVHLDGRVAELEAQVLAAGA